VIEAIEKFYEESNANIHRGIYKLSEKATKQYEDAREKVSKFLNASNYDVIFVRNSTEGINLVANVFQEPGSVLLTEFEHHANIVPWQITKREIDIVSLKQDQTLDEDDLIKKLDEKPALLSMTHISNAVGTINPIEKCIKLAHDGDVKVLVDGSQSVPHMKINLDEMDPDFFVFTGHKMLGPTGIGVVMIKKDIAKDLPPYQGGGDMIESVSFEKTSYLPSPHRFEAGTQNIAGVVGLSAAIDYLEKIGMKEIREHEKQLFKKAWDELKRVEGITLYGPEDTEVHAGMISFTLDYAHPHDIAQIFDSEGIAVRAGHHCCQPLMEHLGVPATARISFYIYNDESDIERVISALNKVKETFK
jgi:cysteine desulfurase/selenocysteine lyase